MRYDYLEIKGTYEGRQGEVINTNNRILYEQDDDEIAVVNAIIQLQQTIETQVNNLLLN